MSNFIENILKEAAVSQYITPEQLEILKKKFGVVKKLGDGSGIDGFAYLTSDNNVIKFTPNENEAILANKLKGKNYKHYVNVYNTYKIPSTQPNRYVFLILMEVLEPLTLEEDIIFDFFGNIDFYLSTHKKESIQTVINDLINNKKIDNNNLTGKFNKNRKNIQDIANKCISLYAEYTNLKKDLKKFSPTDIHAKNVGRKQNGILAAYDLQLGRGVAGSTKSIKTY